MMGPRGATRTAKLTHYPNIQTFKTEREAAKFNAQLKVDHAAGGQGVAVWLRDAGERERAVVTDCLTP